MKKGNRTASVLSHLLLYCLSIAAVQFNFLVDSIDNVSLNEECKYASLEVKQSANQHLQNNANAGEAKSTQIKALQKIFKNGEGIVNSIQTVQNKVQLCYKCLSLIHLKFSETDIIYPFHHFS